VGSLDQIVRVPKVLDLLSSIRICNDKFVIVTIGLPSNLVQQPRVAPFEKPDHR